MSNLSGVTVFLDCLYRCCGDGKVSLSCTCPVLCPSSLSHSEITLRIVVMLSSTVEKVEK